MSHSDIQTARIGPFPWWRYAVVSRRFPDLSVGYFTYRAAVEFWGRAHAEFGERPYLLRRTGVRTFRVIR